MGYIWDMGRRDSMGMDQTTMAGSWDHHWRLEAEKNKTETDNFQQTLEIK